MKTRHPSRGSSFLLYVLILGVVVIITVAATLWVSRTWLTPTQMEPVTLGRDEIHALEAKLSELHKARGIDWPEHPETEAPSPAPAPYRERPEDRIIEFTERELNAMIARNPDLAGRMALHLGQDTLSANMLIPMPEDFPLFGGRELRVSTGLSIHQREDGPAFIIEGVSLMGIPLPAAWLGGLKGQDLMELYRPHSGFWHAVGEGIEDVRVEQGLLRVELAK